MLVVGVGGWVVGVVEVVVILGLPGDTGIVVVVEMGGGVVGVGPMPKVYIG